MRDALSAFVAASSVTPWLVVILPGLAVFLVTLGQELDSKRDWASVTAGVVVGVIASVLQAASHTWRNRISQSEGAEAGRLRVAMQDALQPVAELISSMPSMGKREREARLAEVCQQAVGALTLLLKDVDRLRAVIYAIDEGGNSMACVAYQGRGQKPRPFERGTDRGDRALEMVAKGGNIFVPDLETDLVPVDYGGTAGDYRTFISAAISTGEAAFGMVTVDAPTAHDLVGTDQQIVMLVADLLAIAFAEVAR